MRDVTISLAAKRAARLAGIFGNVEARLSRMARRSAPVTHPCGNRRFQEFILEIEKGVVKGVVRMDEAAVGA
jgi:hypothetical protein